MQKYKVEIFSTPQCHYCHMAKDWFKQHGIEYVDYDVTQDKTRRQELIDLGAMGVPLIRVTEIVEEDFKKTIIDPSKVKPAEPIIISGFDVEHLKQIFDIK